MQRAFIALSLIGSLGFLVGPAANADDRVYYFSRVKMKDAEDKGDITEETPAQITVGKKLVIPASDVHDVEYVERLARDNRSRYRSAISAEKAIDKAGTGAPRRAAIEGAIKAYTDVLGDVKGVKFANRHIDYKIAQLTARLAAEDKSQRKAAAALLAKFTQNHKDGWQISRVIQRLADLQLELEDFKGAAASLKEMQAMQGIPEDVKATIPRRMVEILVKAKEYNEAAAQIDKLIGKMNRTDPEYFPLTLLKLQMNANVPGKLDATVKQLEDIIKETKDRKQLSVCYNTLGNLYLNNNRLKEALYAFLYVDLEYSDNKIEHAKACAELARLFDKIKRPDRAKEYAEKAERLRK
jgi:predicted negative regulator of RcsB-dependent stress response